MYKASWALNAHILLIMISEIYYNYLSCLAYKHLSEIPQNHVPVTGITIIIL